MNTDFKERPLLFSGAMVRAILNGSKSQTRRIVKPQPIPFGKSAYGGTRQGWVWKPETLNRSWNDDDSDPYNKSPLATPALACECPYGVPGNRLWVKETFAIENRDIFYRADSTSVSGDWKNIRPELLAAMEKVEAGAIALSKPSPFDKPPSKWKPSIFMPHYASRITLEVVKIRVERLQEISEADAIAEGVTIKVDAEIAARIAQDSPGRMEYWHLWESINGKGSWDKNPWVWVVEFKELVSPSTESQATNDGTHFKTGMKLLVVFPDGRKQVTRVCESSGDFVSTTFGTFNLKTMRYVAGDDVRLEIPAVKEVV